MESRRISTLRGFTLLEVLVIIGLFAIIAGLGLFLDMSSYHGFHFHNERDTIVNVIQKARSQAVNNMCFGTGCTDGKPHGVYFGTPGSYLIFQGTSYATRDSAVDETITAEDNAVQLTGFTSVVFSSFAGTAATVPATPSKLSVTDVSGRVSVITVEPEGRIWWTN